MKLTKNQQMLLGVAALAGVAYFLYNRNKTTTTAKTNGEETSEFRGGRTARNKKRFDRASNYKFCDCYKDGVQVGVCQDSFGDCRCCGRAAKGQAR